MAVPGLPDGLVAEAVLTHRPDRLVVRARRPGEAPVVAKATPPGARFGVRADLRREGRLLRGLAAVAGVVRLGAVVDRRQTVLVLGLVPAGTLATRPDAPVDAALRRTVEDLHRLGVVHGALTADHVLLTAELEPVLCGFGHATRTTDPAARHADLAALDRLLHHHPRSGT